MYKKFITFSSAFIVSTLAAQTYQVGDVVDDYHLVDYRTGQTTSLYELGAEGGVLVLEWFAWWCPFCARASANVETGIVEYYRDAGGNPYGLPVGHIALNVQGNAREKSDAFIDTYGLGTVLEDYSRDFFHLFNTSSGQPLFVIINAEPDSPSAAQWEVLYVRLNYFTNEAPDMSALMRPVIDAVMPRMETNPVEALFPGIMGPTDGWYQSSWFGWFFASAFPLVNHLELGYGYLGSAPGEGNIHFHRSDLGWLFTGSGFFPYLYCYKTGNWLLYLEGSNGQWFYNFSVNTWQTPAQIGT